MIELSPMLISPVNGIDVRTYTYLGNNPRMESDSLYSRIVQAYRAAGLAHTQTAIAKSLRVSQSSVAQWKANGQIKIAHVREIAQKTGVCVEWLYTGRGPMKPPPMKVAELIDELNDLDAESLDRVLKIARALQD